MTLWLQQQPLPALLLHAVMRRQWQRQGLQQHVGNQQQQRQGRQQSRPFQA